MNEYIKQILSQKYGNKKIGFCGDSITQGYEAYYQGYAQRIEKAGFFKETINVAAGGSNIKAVLSSQLPKLLSEHPDVDIISIATTTNNFSGGTSVGDWYTETSGHREYNYDDTIKGCINQIMQYIGNNFPNAKVIWCTPIRKANWEDDGSIGSQGDDMYPKNGVYLSDYRNAIMEIPSVWSASALDMWSLSNIDPHIQGHRETFFNGVRQWSGTTIIDGVHVGPIGGKRMFEAYLSYLLSWT